MSTMYETIAALCEVRGVSITTMCKKSGTARASLTDLKMGRKKSLSAKSLAKIAAY